MNKESTGTTGSGAERGVPASISPGLLRALSATLARTRKPPKKLGQREVAAAVAATEELAQLAPATATQLLRGLRNLQLVTAEDEPTQAYLQLLRGNTDADWKDFVDAHFDYLLENEVSLLDLNTDELRKRLSQHHPDVGRSTLAATGRLIRGMMTRSFETKFSEPEEVPTPAPVREAARPQKSARTEAPAGPSSPRKTTDPGTLPASVTRQLSTTAAGPADSAAGAASKPAEPAAEQPARTARRRARPKETKESASTTAIPLTGSITLPLGGSNSATLSWSVTTFDAASMEVVTNQLELAANVIRELKEKAS